MEARDKADSDHPLAAALHEKLVALFRTYLLVGGMPDVVAKWVASHDYMQCQELQDDIILGYEDDFPKYRKKVDPNLLRMTLRSVASQTTQKFTYSVVGGYRTYGKLVSSQIVDDDVTAEALLQFVDALENENSSMSLVKELKAIIDSLPDGALFYGLCHEFVNGVGERRSHIQSTLNDMYEAFGVRHKVKKSILDGTNPLISRNLVEVVGNKEDMTLTSKGQKLFLREDFGAFGQQFYGLNLYSFVQTVKEYVHGRDHDVDHPLAMSRLSEKINLFEDANIGNIPVLARIRNVIQETDLRSHHPSGPSVILRLGRHLDFSEKIAKFALTKKRT